MNPRALALARAFLDALRPAQPDNGACTFCGDTKHTPVGGSGERYASIKVYEYRGRPLPMCSRCVTSLGWTLAARGLEKYRFLIPGRGAFDDLPDLVLAEWAAKRMLQKVAELQHARARRCAQF